MLEEKIKAPKGKFAVCLWDSYPRMEPPIDIVETFDTEEEAGKYSKEKNDELKRTFYANKAGRLSPEEIAACLMDGRDRMIEPEYFVMNDMGLRID
jgi:hypothetical protein